MRFVPSVRGVGLEAPTLRQAQGRLYAKNKSINFSETLDIALFSAYISCCFDGHLYQLRITNYELRITNYELRVGSRLVVH